LLLDNEDTAHFDDRVHELADGAAEWILRGRAALD
jgi:hypothetical protein